MTEAGIQFVPQIRLGDVLTLAAFIFGGVGAFWNIKYTLKFFGYRLDIMDATIEDIKHSHKGDAGLRADMDNVKSEQAIQRREMFELRHGKGWVQEDVNGMYTRRGKVEGL